MLKALPFATSYLLAPLVLFAALWGGWWMLGPVVFGWLIITGLDLATPLNNRNLDRPIPRRCSGIN